MKTPSIFLLIVSAAAAAAFLPGGVQGQDQATDRGATRPQARAGAPVSGMIGILRHGTWECALPGDAGGEAFIAVPEEGFRIGTASSYANAQGSGIYLLRGTQMVFTRGPKKDQRFRVLGENTLQKLDPDGSPSRLICTQLGGAN